MSNEQNSPPQGYGHDAKGAAGGKNVPDGRVTVSHSEPIGAVGGKGGGPQIIKFELDGQQVEARVGETIWQVAKRQGREIPHLCYSPAPDYRPDGNCRACMVEI
jgi:formate dehydrogenase major subunit